jgi:hypothetical protein
MWNLIQIMSMNICTYTLYMKYCLNMVTVWNFEVISDRFKWTESALALRVRAHQGNWQPQFLRTVISLSWMHVTKWSSANWANGNATRKKTEKLTSRQWSMPVSSQLRCFLCQLFYNTGQWDLFIKMARKVDEAANFVFVQLIEWEPGIYDKCHSDC